MSLARRDAVDEAAGEDDEDVDDRGTPSPIQRRRAATRSARS